MAVERLFKDEATEEQYERARMASFVGAMTVADLVKTTSLYDFLHPSVEYSKPLIRNSRVKIALGTTRALDMFAIFLILSLSALFVFSFYRSLSISLSSLPPITHFPFPIQKSHTLQNSPKFSFTIKVLTYDRLASVTRCLKSLSDAHYDNEKMNLHTVLIYVPNHLHLMVFELVKNSLRVFEERFMDSDKLAPPIRIIVSDEGGGIPRSGLPRIFTYLYSSAKNPLTERANLGTADIATMARYVDSRRDEYLNDSFFLIYDNEKIYYPNSVLSTKPISNFYRSPDMGGNVEFSIDFATSIEEIRQYLEKNPQMWHPNHNFVMKEIENVNKIKMALFFNHTMYFQDYGEKNKRRSELVLELKKFFSSLV
ncbi:mechanosensitive ion channel protein 10-like protein [Tanacetum coccineum]